MNRNRGIFTLTGKLMDETSIEALEIQDNTGKTRVIKLNDVIKLIDDGLVRGCKTVKDEEGNTKILSRLTNIADLPIINNKNIGQLEIVAKVVNSEGELTAYGCKNEAGKILSIKLSNVWDMTRGGIVTNAKAFILKDKKAIIGTETDLSSLPVIKR